MNDTLTFITSNWIHCDENGLDNKCDRRNLSIPWYIRMWSLPQWKQVEDPSHPSLGYGGKIWMVVLHASIWENLSMIKMSQEIFEDEKYLVSFVPQTTEHCCRNTLDWLLLTFRTLTLEYRLYSYGIWLLSPLYRW